MAATERIPFSLLSVASSSVIQYIIIPFIYGSIITVVFSKSSPKWIRPQALYGTVNTFMSEVF